MNPITLPGKTRKERLVRNLLIALITVIMIMVGIIGYLFFNESGKIHDLQYPYSCENLTPYLDTAYKTTNVAPSFASDLCVSDGNVASDISFSSGQERGLLFNLETKEAVFSQGAYDTVYPASITKLMTALIVAKYGNLDDEVTMEASDFALDAQSQMSGLDIGDEVTMKQLFSALLVYSANDTAMAIARHMSGSTEAFVDLMNQEAQQLGMTGTHFVNPHGLHDDNHYTTAYDIYLMLNEISKYTEITDVMKNAYYTLEIWGKDGSYKAYNLPSTDKYLNGEHTLPEGITIMAGKTGTTDEAGSCLALAVQNRYGIPYISIVLNAYNKPTLYADMDTLLAKTNS